MRTTFAFTVMLLLSSMAVSLIAQAEDAHVDAVIKAVESARGKFEKTEDGKSLKLVDLAVPNAGPHDKRTTDPYDAAFFEHLGHITSLESLNVISTKANDEWIKPLGKLTNLETLRFTNNGKLTDEGMSTFSHLRNLETFSFVGTAITGKAYAKFEGFTKVTRVSHRGSQINDEGLKELCEHLPNLESISLAHAKFTDVGAVHLAKLTKLKSLEIGTQLATPAALNHILQLPLESLQLGEGFHSRDALTTIKSITTLRKLSITDGSKLTDDDLRYIGSFSQLESLSMDKCELTEQRLPIIASFANFKSLSFALRPKGYPADIQSKVKALLPNVKVEFVQ